MIRLFAFLLGVLVAGAAHAQVNTFNADVKMCSGRPWVDVTCNGADPTGAADSTAAINTTFNAAITNNWPVFFPIGTYKVTSKITVDYQGIAGAGLAVVSSGATIDGRTIPSGNVLQIQCSGGTVPAPVVCKNLRISGKLTVLGNANAYVVVIGKSDFSDRHDGARIEQLIVVNNSNTGGAGAIQLNYVTGGNLWLSGTTIGGSSSVGAVTLEQVQTSRLGGYASALGASAPGVLIENGASTGDSFVGFEYDPNDNTCVSVTSANARANSWLVPVFGCNTAMNAPAGAKNTLLGPSFVGANMGPTSGGTAVVGRGSLHRYQAPSVASIALAGVDDGTIFSSANATGAQTQWTAASLPVTLPDPAAVGSGWSTGFVTDNAKAVVLTVTAGKILAGDRQLTTMTVGASGITGFESAVLVSDGANFRMEHLSQGAAMLNGAQAGFSTRWIFTGGPGYQATAGDNGNVVSSSQTSAGLTVTLPPTTSIPYGWMVALAAAGGKPMSVQVSGTSGGQIAGFGSQLASSLALPNPSTSWIQFDGGSTFWVVNSNIPPPGSTTIDNKTGAITSAMEGGGITAVSKPGITAAQIWTWVSAPVGASPNGISYDAVRGVAYDNGGQTIGLTNGVGGYAVSNSVPGPPGGTPTSVALFGVGIAAANGSEVWGSDVAVSDNQGQTVSAGTNRALRGYEADINITSPNSTFLGFVVQGASLSQPAIGFEFSCGPLSFAKAAIQASACYQANDYVTSIALQVGVNGSTGNPGAWPPPNVAGTGSQFITMDYIDAVNTKRRAFINASNEPAAGAGLPAIAINGDSPSVAMNLGLVNGFFWTQDHTETAVPTGILLGAQTAAGANVNSQLLTLGYFDNTATKQNLNVSAQGGASPIFLLSTTAGGGTPAIQVGASLGVTCPTGAPTSSFAVVGGVVTHC